MKKILFIAALATGISIVVAHAQSERIIKGPQSVHQVASAREDRLEARRHNIAKTRERLNRTASRFARLTRIFR